MFAIYDIMFKFVLFLGASYFIIQDIQQLRTRLGRNQITLWTYLNIIPLGLLVFVLVWDTFFSTAEEARRSEL